jgi:hypothetical protein
MNPYMVFSQEQRAKIVKADPSRKADIGGVAKEIGAMWRNLSEKEKAAYRGKTRKASKVKKVKASAPAKTRKTRKEGKRRLLNPYMEFFKANYSRVAKNHPGGAAEVAKEIGKMWAKQK